MIVLVALQGAVLALLAVLVVGLLRSHGEILRRLHELGAGLDDPRPGPPSPITLAPSARPHEGDAAGHDIRGETLDGEQAAIAVVSTGGRTLVAFLSTGCTTCGGFWEAFSGTAGDDVGLGLPAGTRLVVVTRGPDAESVPALRRLATGRVPVVLSTEAWERYGVPGSPYFILVDGPSGRIVGEGTAERWDQVRSLVAQATDDDAAAGPRPLGARQGHRDRVARVDAELLAAGIGPGHPSLHPSLDPGLHPDGHADEEPAAG